MIADAAQNSLDSDCGLEIRDGVRRYTGGSNDTNSYAVLGQFIRTGDFRRSFAQGPGAASLAGPLLEKAAYPDVLVAQAISDGSDLRLVLYPGNGDRRQTLGLARLKPGQSYTVTGAKVTTIRASSEGLANLEIMLHGRTEVALALI